MADQSAPLPNDSLPFELNHIAFWVALAFGVIFGMWEYDEAQLPGQQYSDPLLPVLYCAWLFGVPAYHIALIVRVERARRRRLKIGSAGCCSATMECGH